MMALCVLIVTLVLPKQARFRFEYEKGKKWMQKDLSSPYSFAIKKTNAEIEKDRKEILRAILPIYQDNEEVALLALENFNTDFETKWKDSGGSESDKIRYELLGTNLLKKIYKRGIINSIKKYQAEGPNYNFSIAKNNISGQLNSIEVYTVITAEKHINIQLKGIANPNIRNWLSKLLKNHLQANYIYDERLTDKLEADALSSISTTRGMVQKGELIVAKGTNVKGETYQKLESLKAAYEEDAKVAGNSKLVLVGQFLIVGLV